MSIRIQPGLIFLEQDELEEVTDGGIILAGAAGKNSSNHANRARITDIHPQTAEECGLVVGMEVLVNPYAMREVNIDAKTRRLAIVPGDVMAIYERKETAKRGKGQKRASSSK